MEPYTPTSPRTIPPGYYMPELPSGLARHESGSRHLVGLGLSTPNKIDEADEDRISLAEAGSRSSRSDVGRARMESENTLLPTSPAPILQKSPNVEAEVSLTMDDPKASRRRTIDDEQIAMDWDPPSTWQSPPSPRASPIPYDERRLSASVQIARPQSIVGAPADPNPTSGGRKGSACYASIFSFDDVVGDARSEKDNDRPAVADPGDGTGSKDELHNAQQS